MNTNIQTQEEMYQRLPGENDIDNIDEQDDIDEKDDEIEESDWEDEEEEAEKDELDGPANDLIGQPAADDDEDE